MAFSIFSHSAAENAGGDFLSNVQKSGMTFYWDPLTSSGMLEKNGHRISFHSGDSFVLQDYKIVLKEKAPVLENGVLVSSSGFIESLEKFFKTEHRPSWSYIRSCQDLLPFLP